MDDLLTAHAIASYECGPDMLLKPECLMHFCQEIAEQHASLNGLGYEWGMENHLIWVETQGDYELLRRPRWKETVHLRTNTGKASPLQARRFVEMTDAEGTVIAKADLMWALIDIGSRRPVPLKRAGLSLADGCPPIITSPVMATPSPEGFSPVQAESAFSAPKRDMDFNGHINNSAYFVWAWETLPPAMQPGEFPARFRISFKRESHAGDAISVLHSLSGRQTRHLISCNGATRAEVSMEWK